MYKTWSLHESLRIRKDDIFPGSKINVNGSSTNPLILEVTAIHPASNGDALFTCELGGEEWRGKFDPTTRSVELVQGEPPSRDGLRSLSYEQGV